VWKARPYAVVKVQVKKVKKINKQILNWILLLNDVYSVEQNKKIKEQNKKLKEQKTKN